MRYATMMTVCMTAMAACWLTISTPNVQADSPSNYKRGPWHFVDLWWDLGSKHEFVSYSIDVTIAGKLDPDTRLYFSPIGLGDFDGQKFYGGIQTQLGRAHPRNDPNKWLNDLGPGAIFSRWGTRTLDAVRTADGGVCESAGYEGDFVSVRRPFKWAIGKYTYRLVRMDQQMVDGKPYTWVGCFVYDHQRDEHAFIGALRFSGAKLTLNSRIASFVELYGAMIDPDRIPPVQITYSNIHINGEAVEPKSCTAVYPDHVPDYADTRAVEGRGAEIDLGKRVDRKQRRQRVF